MDKNKSCTPDNQSTSDAGGTVVAAPTMVQSKITAECETNKTLSDEEVGELELVERAELQSFIDELKTKISAKVAFRESNTSFELPNESYLCRLDSNLKKNTAFVKKLKQFTASQLDATLRDMSSLNLSKYISEICAALCEAKLKMADVNAVIILCSKLHQTYADFDVLFFEAWQKVLHIKPTEKLLNPSKLRVDLRLFADLISSGVINTKQGLGLLGNVLVHLIAQDKDDHSNFATIFSFCRHCGEEYAGLVPSKMQMLAEKYEMQIPKSDFLTPDKQHNLRGLLKEYFKGLCKHLLNEQSELMNMTKNLKRTMESKGEISNEKKEKCEIMQLNFDKLLSSAQTLSDLIGEKLPTMTKEIETTPGTLIENMLNDKSLGEMDPWGDEETRMFYTELPDLRQFLPNFSAPKIDLEQLDEPGELTEEAIEAKIDADIDIDDPPSNASDTPVDKESELDISNVLTNTLNIKCEEDDTEPRGSKEKNCTASNEARRHSAQNTNANATIKYQFECFMQNLFNCVNKELIDSAAIEFLLNFNSKNNRKKLTKCIFAVQRTRLDMLPFLSRFVAIVNLCNTDIASDLSEMLRKEFKWHIRKKNQLNIESKIKIIRFIGEMVKFGLFKKFDALGCLKMLLRDFQHHQIEMACAFVEVAGVYLYNCRDSRLLTNVFLDQMLRLKTATALDSRHAAQIECAYYLVKPPEATKIAPKTRPPMHEYIRHLIFEELCKQNVDRCIKMMRRIDWADPIINAYAIKCLSKAYLLRFPLIRCLADLVAGLSSYQPMAITMVIDNVFEDIRAGLEIHSPKLAQRRIAMTKYLGELYNYKLVESTNIINTLYSIISLGVSTEEGTPSVYDPPDSLFRLKLACVLLDTSGPYFTSTQTRKKLDYFLVFFQHYYWFKKSNTIFNQPGYTHDLFPILIDHMYKDCLAAVRPRLKLFKSFEEVKEAIEELKTKLYPQLSSENYSTESVIDCENSDIDEGSDDTSSERHHREIYDFDCEQPNPVEIEWTENEIERQKIETQPQKSKDDLEFEQLFEKMTADSFQERIKGVNKQNTKDIPVPMLGRATQKKTMEHLNCHSIVINSATTALSGRQIDGSSESARGNSSLSEPKSEAVPFVLMVRGNKGGKQQFKTFIAEPDSALAINLKLQEQKTREENERVKRLTLNITERIEEEDYEESLLQSQRNYSQGHYQRINKQKFKHQKGAPDADLIFN